MMSVVVLMTIFSFPSVVDPYRFRIFPGPRSLLLNGTFDRALHILDRALNLAFEFVPLSLSLEFLVAGQVPDGLLDPAFALVDHFAHVPPPDNNNPISYSFSMMIPLKMIEWLKIR